MDTPHPVPSQARPGSGQTRFDMGTKIAYKARVHRRDHQRSTVRAESDFSVMHGVSLIGAAVVCWFAWQSTRPPSLPVDPAPVAGVQQSSPSSNTSSVVRANPAPVRSSPASAGVSATRSEPVPPFELVNPLPETRVTTGETAAASARVRTNRPVASPPEPRDAEPFQTRRVADVFEAQLVLARLGFSAGPIDGQSGTQTRRAMTAFQQREGLSPTGLLDPSTRERLWLRYEPYREIVISQDVIDSFQPVRSTWAGKAGQTELAYENALEYAAEQGWAYQSFVARLNPGVDWMRIQPGTRVRIPNVRPPTFSGRAMLVRIALSERSLRVFDENNRIMAHFPCSIGRLAEKRPVGKLRVVRFTANPTYLFQPELFQDSPEARTVGDNLTLPPGPNNPVGLVWIGLDKQGYGIHGTPDPEKVGRTESLGCFRLSNWNAQILLDLVWQDMPVYVEP